MTEIGKEKESTRSLKQLLIHELLKANFKVFEPLGMRDGSNLIIGDFVEGDFRCVAAQVETASLGNDYVFNIAARNDFRENARFFYFLCLENPHDEYRPYLLFIPTPQLKSLIEKRLRSPESWRTDRPYGCHLSLKQLQEDEWKNYKGRFDLIRSAAGI